jgi:hypothetical protein
MVQTLGCSATLYISDDKRALWHQKMAPRGIATINLGLRF